MCFYATLLHSSPVTRPESEGAIMLLQRNPRELRSQLTITPGVPDLVPHLTSLWPFEPSETLVVMEQSELLLILFKLPVYKLHEKKIFALCHWVLGCYAATYDCHRECCLGLTCAIQINRCLAPSLLSKDFREIAVLRPLTWVPRERARRNWLENIQNTDTSCFIKNCPTRKSHQPTRKLRFKKMSGENKWITKKWKLGCH